MEKDNHQWYTLIYERGENNDIGKYGNIIRQSQGRWICSWSI